MRFSLPILVLLTIGIIGCSSSQQYYIDPSYSENKVDASVLVVPLQSSWFEGNFTHTFGSLSGTGKTTFYNSLEPLLSEYIYSSVELIDAEQSFDNDMFYSSKLKLGNDSLDVILPKENSSFSMSEQQPQMVLFLDQYFFRKKQKTLSGSSYAGHEEGSTRTLLYFETKYIFWDTSNNKPIAWGSTDSSVSLSSSGNVNSADYYKVLSQAVEKLSKRSPIM